MTMTHDKILEMAGLDGFGLLDPAEREAFEAAMRSAEPALQAEVRQVQDTVLALEISALPDVEPDPPLRGRVVGSICRLIEEDFRGTLHEDGVARPIGRVPATGLRARFFQGGVSPIWRVAALVFVTCSLFLSWLTFEVHNISQQMQDAYVNNEVKQWIHDELGANSLEIILHPTSKRVAFAPVSPDLSGAATFTYVSSQRLGYLIADNLPANDLEYQLCISPTEDGSNATRLAAFTSDGGTVGVAVEFTEDQMALVEGFWWVIEPSLDGSEPTPVLAGRL